MKDQDKTTTQLVEELEELRARVAALEGMVQRSDDTMRWLETALDTMQLGVTIVDQHGVIRYTNPTEAALHGHEVADLIGKNVGLFATAEQRRPLTLDQLKRMRSWQRESTNVRSDGSTFPVYLRSDLVKGPGDVYAIVTTCEDITARKYDRTTSDDIQSGYLLAAASSNDGLWDWNLATDEVYYTPRWGFILGHGEDEIGSSPSEWFDRVHPDDQDRVKQEVDDHVAGKTPHLESECRMRHKDGEYRWILIRGLAVRDGTGHTFRMAGSITDITNRKAVEQRLIDDAFHDPLTGLGNRALLLHFLERSIGRARRREGFFFALVLFNLNRFRMVNESLGHDIGDELLCEVARRLQPGIRPSDTLVRVSADEFAVLLDDIADISDATRVGNRIGAQMHASFNLSGHEIFSSVKIGIALSASGYRRPEEILRDAGIALDRARSLAGIPQVFDPAMHQVAVARLQLETDLQRALDQAEFRVFYQPIVSLPSGNIEGFEALLRWHHSERGLLLPKDFLGVLEETGLILPVGWWAFREACDRFRSWQDLVSDQSALTLSINFSARQLSEGGVVERIRDVLQETGLEGQRLRLEMTETAIMADVEPVLTKLSTLKALQLQLHVDDFGTGYSSLSYLQRFPIDTLKIDRSFVSNLGKRPASLEIIKAIMSLAHSLGMPVVAEGVETEEQLAELNRLDCEFAQGHYFSWPVDADRVPDLLRKGVLVP